MLRRWSSDECARQGSVESARGSDIVVVVVIIIVVVVIVVDDAIAGRLEVINGGKVQRRQAATTLTPARRWFRVGQLAVAEPKADLQGQTNGGMI